MKTQKSLILKFGFASILVGLLVCSLTFAAPNGPPPPPEKLPVYRLSSTQQSAVLSNTTKHYLVDLDVKTAAYAKVLGNFGNAINYSVQDVDRATNDVSAVYVNAYTSSPAVMKNDLLPIKSNELYDFKETGDAVQAFAYMKEYSLPTLQLWALGKTEGFVNASWTTRFENTSGKMQNVYLTFMLPQVKVEGETEQDAPAQWRSRVKVEVMVNGYPAWSTEALRINDLGQAIFNKPYFLGSFGSDISLSESTGTADMQRVTLFLGYFKSGQNANVSLQVSGEVEVDKPCVFKKEEWFCTRANMHIIPTGRLQSASFLTKPTPGTDPDITDSNQEAYPQVLEAARLAN